jgi:hypothetical protein
VKRVASSALAVTLVALAPSAWAVEREHHLGIEAGGAMLVIADKSTPDVGAGLGAHWTYGLSDAFNLVVDGSWSLVAIGEKALDAHTPATRPASVASLDAGVAYVFDVLRWVPWASLELGGYALDGGTISGVKFLPGAAIALGLDYRLTRSWAVGASVRQHAFLDLSTYPSFTQTFARFEYTWGW